jgi:hypothetical protein
MPLSLKQLQDVCLQQVSDNRKCKYLGQDDNDPSLWHCLKKSPKKKEIDDEVVDYLKELKKKGIDPHTQNIPLGDNCSGYPILKFVKQGYDQTGD